MGTTQLLSVPYALHSGTAETLIVNGQIKNVVDPTDDQDVATKAYVDSRITNPGIRIQGVVDSIDCYGAETGAIDLTISGGTEPYLVEWSNGMLSEHISELGAWRYQVYVEDANGMTAFRHFNLFYPEELLVSAEVDNETGIDLTVSGGTPPYSFLWSNGSTNEDLTGVESGVYTVVVNDANGCSISRDMILGGISQQLAEYLESNDSPYGSNYVNTGLPQIRTAASVRTMQLVEKVHIIDTRKAVDYAAGHISGSVNVPSTNVLAYIEGVDLSAYDEISIVGYTGQVSCWLTSLLNLMGHTNVYAMKFGMSAWHEDFNIWSQIISNEKATLFTSDVNAKAPEGEMPVITTVGSTPRETLELRVDELLAEGFGAAAITANEVYANLENYYIINYWPMDEYIDPGHIEGAIQYTPRTDFTLDTHLKTLPTDKAIVVYGYTGQASAALVAYLKVLGYDARSLKFGTNGMIYDEMTKSKWSEGAIMGYDYVNQ